MLFPRLYVIQPTNLMGDLDQPDCMFRYSIIFYEKKYGKVVKNESKCFGCNLKNFKSIKRSTSIRLQFKSENNILRSFVITGISAEQLVQMQHFSRGFVAVEKQRFAIR